MPSGPPELHEKWRKHGPYEGGLANAVKYLEDRGFKLNRNWTWTAPDRFLSTEESMAIDYLILEWDFGGIERRDQLLNKSTRDPSAR